MLPKRQVNIVTVLRVGLKCEAISESGRTRVSDVWMIFPQWVIAERTANSVIKQWTKLAFVPTAESLSSRKIKQGDQMTYWRNTNRGGLWRKRGKSSREKWISFPPTLFLSLPHTLSPAQALDSLCWYTQYLLPERAPSFPPHFYKDARTK